MSPRGRQDKDPVLRRLVELIRRAPFGPDLQPPSNPADIARAKAEAKKHLRKRGGS